MAEEKQTTTMQSGHAASINMKLKDKLYQAEYLGSGTFNISKPTRKKAKRRQSALKGATRGARK